MADARGPSHAVQSVPAVSGGPQVAKGRPAPVGWGGKGGERGRSGRRLVLVKEEREGMEREGLGSSHEKGEKTEYQVPPGLCQ